MSELWTEAHHLGEESLLRVDAAARVEVEGLRRDGLRLGVVERGEVRVREGLHHGTALLWIPAEHAAEKLTRLRRRLRVERLQRLAGAFARLHDDRGIEALPRRWDGFRPAIE